MMMMIHLLGGVGHCCAWHVQVQSSLIGSYVHDIKKLVFPQGCQFLTVAGIPTETLVFLCYFPPHNWRICTCQSNNLK